MAKLLATFATAHALSPSFVERSPPPASALPPARPFDWSGGAEPATTGADAAAWPAVSVTVITRARPAFLDGDGDGDLDLVLGGRDGALAYFENLAGQLALRAGSMNPFNNVQAGSA